MDLSAVKKSGTSGKEKAESPVNLECRSYTEHTSVETAKDRIQAMKTKLSLNTLGIDAVAFQKLHPGIVEVAPCSQYTSDFLVYASEFLLFLFCGHCISQLMQFNTPPSSAMPLIFTGIISLSKTSFAHFTAASSCASPKTGRKICFSVSRKLR